MQIAFIINELENFAPLAYQESYDNCGLIVGDASQKCKGILCTLDATEDVIREAISLGCNLVVAHHPIVFSGLKKLNGKNYVERAVIAAIKNDIAIYAIHTNADNIIAGVNDVIANKLGLIDRKILSPKKNLLAKLITFVPTAHLEQVRNALFDAGTGNIGNYSEASFSVEGMGTYTPNEKANPFLGEKGKMHQEAEGRIEVIFPIYTQRKVIKALKEAHPYEEVAYDIIPLSNDFDQVGSGLIGNLPEAVSEAELLTQIKSSFGLQVIKHTPLCNKPIKKVALCGGSGSFLIKDAIAAGADIYITADVKYHEFFDADGKIVIADIGHWESEQFTVDLLIDIISTKFPTFAVLKSEVNTNSVRYFL